MALILWTCGLWLLTISIHSKMFIFSIPVEEDIDLYEKAHYHFRELRRTINQIGASHNLYKRDTKNQEINISSSLVDICAQLNSGFQVKNLEKTSAKNRKNSEEHDAISFEGKDHPSRWEMPELYLVSAHAKREGKKLYITFNITHSSQAFVMRVYSLDDFKKTIGNPGVYTDSITSEIQLDVDGHEYRDLAYQGNAAFMFGLVDDKRYAIETSIDLRAIAQREKSISKTNVQHNVLEKKGGDSLSPRIDTPKFRIVSSSQHSDEIVINPGENPELLIDINLSSVKEVFRISATLWDWDEGIFVEGGVDVDNNIQRSSQQMSDSILTYDVISSVLLNDTSVGNQSETSDDYQNLVFRARIKVNIGSRALSGKLTLYSIWSGNGDILSFVTSTKDVMMRLPYRLSPLPRNIVQMYGPDEQECRDHGGPSRSCIVHCDAEGTDLKSIFILKSHPYKPPLRSASFTINDHTASSMIDMGAPSEDIEGTYRCFVVTKNGEIASEKVTFLATGFTDIHSFTVEDFGNGTTRVICSASGHQPLDMSLNLLTLDYQTIILKHSDHEAINTSLATVGNQTNLTMLFSTENLLYPTNELECNVLGERGHEIKPIKLSWYIKNYNMTAPLVKRDRFNVEHHDNGTTLIACSASGGEDVDITISVYGTDDRFHIDRMSGGTWTEMETEDGKSLMANLPTKSLPTNDTSVYFCGASNSRGEDWYQFGNVYFG